MATESSAIARFVNLAQSQAIHEAESPPHVEVTMPVPPLQAPQPAIVAANRSTSWLMVVIGLVVIGGSVTGGYLLAQQQTEEEVAKGALGAQGALITPESPVALAAKPAEAKPAEVADNQFAETREAALAVESDALEPPEEPVAEAALAAPPLGEPEAVAAEAEEPEEIEPDVEVPGDIELAKKTGFDVLVEPKGAQVSLDGHVIGNAPLRVRNLLPGPHSIDIEGPKGFFGQHLEFDLRPGHAEILKIDLDSLDVEGTNVEEPSEVPTSPGTPLVSEVAKKQKAKAKQEKKTSRKEERRAKRKERRSEARSSKSSRKKGSSAADQKELRDADKVSMGTLMLGAKPPCQITIDGKRTGLSTPQRSMQLAEGTHRVILTNKEQGIRKSFKVKIKAGRTTRAIQDLTKDL